MWLCGGGGVFINAHQRLTFAYPESSSLLIYSTEFEIQDLVILIPDNSVLLLDVLAATNLLSVFG